MAAPHLTPLPCDADAAEVAAEPEFYDAPSVCVRMDAQTSFVAEWMTERGDREFLRVRVSDLTGQTVATLDLTLSAQAHLATAIEAARR